MWQVDTVRAATDPNIRQTREGQQTQEGQQDCDTRAEGRGRAGKQLRFGA
jgi:hypothetical protein